MLQAPTLEQMEHGAVGELVAGHPPAAAIGAAHQRDALGLGDVLAIADIAPQVATLQVVLAQAGPGGHIFLGDQQAVVGFVAEQRLRHPDRASSADIAECASGLHAPFAVGLHHLIATEAAIQLRQWRDDIVALGIFAGHVGIADQHFVTRALASHPQPVRLLQRFLAEREQWGELRQLEHLYTAVVALDHEHETVVDGGDAVRARELAQGLAAATDGAQALAGVAVVHDQLVGGLGAGDQHQLAVLQPAGRRIDVVVGRRCGDEGLRDHHMRHVMVAQQHVVGFVLVGLAIRRRIGRALGRSRTGREQQRQGKQGEASAHQWILRTDVANRNVLRGADDAFVSPAAARGCHADGIPLSSFGHPGYLQSRVHFRNGIPFNETYRARRQHLTSDFLRCTAAGRARLCSNPGPR